MPFFGKARCTDPHVKWVRQEPMFAFLQKCVENKKGGLFWENTNTWRQGVSADECGDESEHWIGTKG